MKLPYKLKNFVVIVSSLHFYLGGCGANPDTEVSLGSCKLNCSGARPATTEMAIRLFSQEIAIDCSGLTSDSDYNRSIPIKFAIEKNPPGDLPAENLPGATDGESDNLTTGIKSGVAGIGFSVNLVGGMLSATRANPDDSDPKYNGILTGKTEWCTDSCGVGSIEVMPLCRKTDNEIILLLQSGLVASTIKIKVAGTGEEVGGE